MFRLRKKELNLIYTSLQEGKPLPEKYRNIIFNNSRDVELVWKEKSSEVFDKTLDLLPIERSTESIAFNVCQASTIDSKKRWLNKLISGDNKLVLSSLKNGPLREEIENNGGIKLIYIDPPFDVGNDYHIDIEIGDTLIKKDPLVLVELAYKDTWGYGKDSFINMIYERLLIMHELISKDGSLYLHCDWRISGHMREILDEIFGAENFINEIIWHYPDKIPSGVQRLPQNHDTIFFYAKNKQNKKYNVLKVERETPIRLARKKWNPVLGKWRGYERDKDNNIIYDIVYNKIEDDVWRIPAAPVVRGRENLGYPTQKPKELLRRIILMSTDENDIVADFFSGSGTTLEVAQRLNRKWIGNDIGKFAINTSRKRMLGVLSQLKDEGKILKDFELLKVSSPIAKTFPIAPTFLDLSCKDESQACKDESQACKDESLTSNDESQACKDESLFVTDEKREKIFLKKILESYGAIKLEDSF
ncbi:MAG: site-specific DNA-methyltransferase, partial [Deltaproteobacteria bacterium]|nr:site-specific DNA-methyltransferase [Deltaproteobacteria bacterium]